MSIISAGLLSPSLLEVLAISPRQWRIRDSRGPSSDPTTVVGFVAQIGATFEVTLLGEPFRRYYFGTFERALSFIAGSLTD